MALTNRVNIYSVDTSAFFTDMESYCEHERNLLIFEKNLLKAEIDILTKHYNGEITELQAKREYKQLYPDRIEIILPEFAEIEQKRARISDINPLIKEYKDKLKSQFAIHSGTRTLNTSKLKSNNIVSVFESFLTRTIGMNTSTSCNMKSPINKDIIIIRVYYFDVLLDIINDGFMWGKDRYVYFTASAGQIRTKKIVFIKESVLLRHQRTLMCGLTLEDINAKGGVNVNKYLAYLALTNSATDDWKEFDIDKAIVVDDLETNVTGVVDYIDHTTFEITRKSMDIPITHTDGCGMVLPRLCKNNVMVRMPWVKGLLSPFPFHKFIRELNQENPGQNFGIVKDIYGVEHDILKEDIEVIFTKSQFKMHKYYDSWEQYKELFKKHNCGAGKCNEEESYFDDAKINYQMLQTLTDVTDDELLEFCSKTNDTLEKITSDRSTMLRLFGATSYNSKKNNFQEALYLYPELLQDEYSRETLREIKNSVEKEAWAGKLEIEGKYLFIIPDLYAFCEFLFKKEAKPRGLLSNYEVFSSIYKNFDKLDCLRSPHLYKEHAVRNNVVDDEKSRWFVTRGLYVSSHDLISKVLQCDWDGDKSLVCADRKFIEVVERNMEGYVPLYYEMAKAEAQIITPFVVFNGLRMAYTEGNIGFYSNNISKEWNVPTPNVDAIKYLCLLNNFVIDYAKTLYKPQSPKHIEALIKQTTSKKLPHFFVYAKDKSEKSVAYSNDSCVNRIKNLIPKRRLTFGKNNIGKFDYRMLMYSADVSTEYTIPQKIIAKYTELTKNVNARLVEVDDKYNNFEYIFHEIKRALFKVVPDELYVCDVLIKHLFCEKKTTRKMIFWNCFGDIVVNNLKNNIEEKLIQCTKCGIRFYKTHNREELCKSCKKKKPIESREIICEDCGVKVVVKTKASRKTRCDKCSAIKKKIDTKNRVAKHRSEKM